MDNQTQQIETALDELDYDVVKNWLDKGGNVNAILEATQLTPLQDLLLRGAEPDEIASVNKLFNLLLAHDACINIPNVKDDFQPVFLAVKEGYVSAVKRLIEDGADVDLVDTDGYTPLLVAVEMNSYELTKLLVEKSSNATRHKSGGHWAYQPLGLAMNNLNFELINVLLKNGCDPYAKDNDRYQNIERLPTNLDSLHQEKINQILINNGFEYVYGKSDNNKT